MMPSHLHPPRPNTRARPSTAGTLGPGKAWVAWPAAVLALAACLTLSACETRRGLVAAEEPRRISWEDDGSLATLFRAIGRSIEYYRKLSPNKRFHYGDLSYTPQEMIASLNLFRAEMLTAPDAHTFKERLLERFHVFESIRENGENLFTGYYEPELAASETPSGNLKTPVYALPVDIVKVELRKFGGELPSRTLVGRIQNGKLVPYHTRREIQQNDILAGRVQLLAYVDEMELYFLQVQGSGILRFPNGRRVKIGYASSNGHPYRSIGAWLVRKGFLSIEEVSLQTIRAFLAENPEKMREIFYLNPSYIFFQLLDEGPLGNIRVALTPERSLAADRLLIPK